MILKCKRIISHICVCPLHCQMKKSCFSAMDLHWFYAGLNPFVLLCLYSSVHSRYMSTDSQRIVGGVLVGTGLWVTIIMIMRNVLKCLLSWHGWMQERHGTVSWSSRLWLVRQWLVVLCVMFLANLYWNVIVVLFSTWVMQFLPSYVEDIVITCESQKYERKDMTFVMRWHSSCWQGFELKWIFSMKEG